MGTPNLSPKVGNKYIYNNVNNEYDGLNGDVYILVRETSGLYVLFDMKTGTSYSKSTQEIKDVFDGDEGCFILAQTCHIETTI